MPKNRWKGNSIYWCFVSCFHFLAVMTSRNSPLKGKQRLLNHHTPPLAGAIGIKQQKIIWDVHKMYKSCHCYGIRGEKYRFKAEYSGTWQKGLLWCLCFNIFIIIKQKIDLYFECCNSSEPKSRSRFISSELKERQEVCSWCQVLLAFRHIYKS